MKSITNRSVVLVTKEDGTEDKATIGDLIKAVCRQTPEGGFTIEDVRARMRVVDAVDLAIKSDKAINLEDADHATLLACVQQMRWGILSKGIIEFNELIEKAGS